MNDTSRMTQLLGAFRRERNGLVADTMHYEGARYGLNYGVSLPTVRSTVRPLERDHAFARYLYGQDVRCLKLAAFHLADPDALTDEAERRIKESKPDFVFLYMVETDEKGGHDNGWMSEEYLRRISIAIDNVKRMVESFGDEYSVIVMADHGGHDRSHGTTMPEDMTVPFFFYGPDFEKGKVVDGVSLLEIAPTIAKIMGIVPEREWDGKPVF